MSLSEFDLITRYFTAQDYRADVELGVGDDAAVVTPQAAQNIVLTSCVETIQSFSTQHPAACAERGVATIAGRLLARRAPLQWVLLNLTLTPPPPTSWVAEFSRRVQHALKPWNASLIGGDTTAGTATVVFTGISSRAVAVPGDLPEGGELIYVTGTLGNQALALLELQHEITLIKSTKTWVQHKLFTPTLPPGLGTLMQSSKVHAYPLELGLVDTLEFLGARKLGAEIYLDQLPVDPRCLTYLEKMGGRTLLAETAELGEFILMVAECDQRQFETEAKKHEIQFTWIGITTQTAGVRLV